MKFSAFDIISKLVPGGLLIVFCLISILPLYTDSQTGKYIIDTLKGFDGLLTFLAILFVYLLGYILEALGSLVVEPVLWKIWGGWPITLLYKDKTTMRTTFPQKDRVFSKLIQACFDENLDELSKNHLDELYYFSSRTLRGMGNEEQINRQQSYIEAYLFSRNLLTGLIVSIIVISIGAINYKGIFIWILISLMLMFILVLFRIKDRALYQVRNLLNSSYQIIANANN